MGPLYWKTVYRGGGPLYGGRHVSWSSPDWTNSTPFEFVWQLKATTGSPSCLEGEGEVRGVQLPHDNSPLYVTKSYTLQLLILTVGQMLRDCRCCKMKLTLSRRLSPLLLPASEERPGSKVFKAMAAFLSIILCCISRSSSHFLASSSSFFSLATLTPLQWCASSAGYLEYSQYVSQPL